MSAAKSDCWAVRVVETRTGKLEREMLCATERKASQVEDGVLINLDVERFYVEVKRVKRVRLHRVSYNHLEAGSCYSWHVRRKDAEREARRLRKDEEADNVDVAEVFIPTSAARLARWLDANLTRDNG